MGSLLFGAVARRDQQLVLHAQTLLDADRELPACMLALLRAAVP